MKGRFVTAAFAAVLAAGFCTFDAPSAFAQPRTSEKAALDQRAHDLFQKGDTAYAEGRYEEALAAFEEAYELSSRPQLLFNVSNSLERLGRYSEAVEALEKYLSSGKARDKDVVQKRLANLKKRVEEQKRIDEKAAKEEEERKAREAEERKRRGLDPIPPTKVDPSGPTQPTPPTKQPEAESSFPILPVVLIGTGVAALATGTVFGVMTLGVRSDVKNGCGAEGDGGRLCQDSVRSDIDKEKTFGLVADLSWLGGAILTGVGAVLLLTSHPAEKPREAITKIPVRVVGTKGGGGFEFVGRF